MTTKNWEKVSSRAKAVFNFGIEKAKWLETSKTAKFIAAIPFLAGCEKVEETSFSHLAIYIMSIDESSKDLYFHKPEDDGDVYSRLQPISCFIGGDAVIIKCCMDLLALNMINGYKRDMEADKAVGKYNPLNAGSWDYNEMSTGLQKSIEDAITPEIEELYSVNDARGIYWRD